jgi:hypothetical protein
MVRPHVAHQKAGRLDERGGVGIAERGADAGMDGGKQKVGGAVAASRQQP